ncbi:MAG: fibronectin type III domain-containing protein [Thermoplasmatota archaeon]
MRNRKDSAMGKIPRITALSAVVILLGSLLTMIPGVIDDARGTQYVGPNSTYESIQDAIDASSGFETIHIEGGTYNETVTIDKPGITLSANETDPVTIVGQDISYTLVIRESNATIVNVVLESGGMDIRSNDTTVKNITIRGGTDSPVNAVNVSGLTVSGSRFLSTSVIALNVTDSDGIIVDNSYFDNAARMIQINNCSGGYINDTSLISSLGDFGMRISRSDHILINNTNIPDGAASYGLVINRSSMIEISSSDLSIDGYGHMITDSDNVTIDSVNINVYADLVRGIAINNTRDILIKSTLVDISGSGSIGIDVTGSDGLTVNRSDFYERSEKSIGIQMASTADSIVLSSGFYLKSDNSFGLVMEGINSGAGFSGNIVQISSNLSIGLDIRSAVDFVLKDNDFEVTQTHSTGARFSANTLDISNNTISVDSESGGGYIIGSDIVDIFGEDISLNGDFNIGIMAISDEIVINSTYIEIAGSMSNGLIITGDTGEASIVDSDMIISGIDSNGIICDSPGSEIEVIDLSLTSSSSSDSLFIRDSNLALHKSDVRSLGPAVTLLNCSDSIVSQSVISGSPSIFAMETELTVLSSNLTSGQFSIQAFDSSLIECVNCIVNNAESTSGSMIYVKNVVSIRLLDVFGSPYQDVDVRITDGDQPIYASQHFGGSDGTTDANGMIPPMRYVYGFYSEGTILHINITLLEVYKKGSADIWNETYEVETVRPGLRVFSSDDIDAPMKPLGLSVTPQNTYERLFLKWDPNTDDTTHYRIYNYSLIEQEWQMAAVIEHPKTSWTSPDLGPSVEMLYRITAWDGLFESVPSDYVSNQTYDLTPPGAPAGLRIISTTTSSIEIGWEVDDPSDYAGFRIEINGTQGQGFVTAASVPGDARSKDITGLSWGTEYRFRIIGFDNSNNYSPYSTEIAHSTDRIVFSITVNASYSMEGPTPGERAYNATVNLLAFNGTVIGTGRTDALGHYTFSDVDMDTYLMAIIPAEEGEIGLRSGYLRNTTDPFELNVSAPEIKIDVLLDYYQMPSQGYVTAHVSYKGGPMDGVDASGSSVQLMNDNGILLREIEAGSAGNAYFVVDKLPLRGRFRVEPPDYLTAEEGVKSGYLTTLTNYFYIDQESPDYGTMEIVLNHYAYIPPPPPLMIIQAEPKGTIINLSTPIVIDFDQPVETITVEQAFISTPQLKDRSFHWNSANTTLTVRHGGLIPDTTYTIEITGTARSSAGTSFPDNYTENSWEFKTAPEIIPDDGNGGGISREMIIIIIIVGIVLFIIVLFVILGRSGNREEGMESEYPEEEYYDDYYDEMDDFPEEEFADEEYLEDEYPEDEYPEDEFEEDEFPEDEEIDEEMVEDLIPDEEMIEEEPMTAEELLDEEYMYEDLEPEEPTPVSVQDDNKLGESEQGEDESAKSLDMMEEDLSEKEPDLETSKPKKRAKKKTRKKMKRH